MPRLIVRLSNPHVPRTYVLNPDVSGDESSVATVYQLQAMVFGHQ